MHSHEMLHSQDGIVVTRLTIVEIGTVDAFVA